MTKPVVGHVAELWIREVSGIHFFLFLHENTGSF